MSGARCSTLKSPAWISQASRELRIGSSEDWTADEDRRLAQARRVDLEKEPEPLIALGERDEDDQRHDDGLHHVEPRRADRAPDDAEDERGGEQQPEEPRQALQLFPELDEALARGELSAGLRGLLRRVGQRRLNQVVSAARAEPRAAPHAPLPGATR